MATRSNAAKKRAQAQQTHREIGGVGLLALGIFLGVCLYSGAVGLVGEAVTGVLFGLTGLFAYAAPVALCAAGILLIACAARTPRRGRTALILLGVVLALTLLQVIAKPLLGTAEYLPYIQGAFINGRVDHNGGGALGAILCYPLLLLTGEAGAYIFLIAGLLIIILLVTSLSLRKTGQQAAQAAQKVKTQIQYASERHAARKQELYTESLEEQAVLNRPAPRPAARVKKERGKTPIMRPDRPDVEFIPQSGAIEKRKPRSLKKEPVGEALMESDFGYEPLVEEPAFMDVLGYDPVEPVMEPMLEPPGNLRRPKPFLPQQEQSPAFAPRAARAGAVEAAPGLAVEPVEELPDWDPGEPLPYVPPSFSLLNASRVSYARSTGESPEVVGQLLVETLQNFNVLAKLVNISVGPVITRFELQPAPGVRVNKITALSDDIALALAAPRVRIEAPIPGKAAVGIEVPNKDIATVVLRDIVESREFSAAKSPITMALGKDIAGNIVVADLGKMPHLLIAGATGSGKSVCINDIIISLIYKSSPEELQLILVDPKVVELSVFGNLPHLRLPVVTDPKKAAGALCGAVKEMTDRYRKFAALGARDLARYNELQENPRERLPKLVIIIDELADLMMVAPDTVEDSICRIAQLGRACGIHLIVATQRPSADIITGLIKANIPSRIAFAVSSAVDSRIILDVAGAEKLLGRGDMLFHPNGAGKPQRCQGAFVSDEEVERVVRHFENQQMTPNFDETMIEDIETGLSSPAQGNGKQEDELLSEAVRVVLDSGQASISMIQRRLRVGYARAARLVDIMEQHGYVSGFDGSKPRKVLISRAQYEQTFGGGGGGNTPRREAPEETPPAGTLRGTAAVAKPRNQAPPPPQKTFTDYDDDDPDAPWARKPGEPPPWEEVPFDEE